MGPSFQLLLRTASLLPGSSPLWLVPTSEDSGRGCRTDGLVSMNLPCCRSNVGMFACFPLTCHTYKPRIVSWGFLLHVHFVGTEFKDLIFE